MTPLRLRATRILKFVGLSLAVRAKRGTQLPVVLSVPDTAALLDAMQGHPPRPR